MYPIDYTKRTHQLSLKNINQAVGHPTVGAKHRAEDLLLILEYSCSVYPV